MPVVSADSGVNARAGQGRPRPGPAVRAELTETSGGWTLLLHCDAATAAVLRAGGIGLGATDRFSVSITPNLVPGEPFAIDEVSINVV